MTPIRRYSPVEWGALVVAAGVTAVGVTMVIAWVFELVPLLDLFNPGPTLRFNTAVLFVLCGLSLACSILGHRKTTEGIALAAFLLSLLCTAKSLNVINLDVENFFFRPDESLNDRIGPGKVALGTSLGALMFSLSIVTQHRLRHGSLFALLLGIAICLISLVALNHYLMEIDAGSSWQLTTGMAVPTAVMLFLLGAAAIALSSGAERSSRPTYWLSCSLALGFAVASFMVWRELVDNETSHLQRETAVAAAAVKLQIKERLQTRLMAVDRFALRWGSLDRDEQRKDAKRLLEDFDGILSLYWVTEDLRIGWICARDDRQDFVGTPLPAGPRHDAVRQARKLRAFTFTPVIQLLHDEAGFIGYVPTFNSAGEVSGYVAAIFRLQMFLESIAADRRYTGYDFSISDADRHVFASVNDPPVDPALTVTKKLDQRGLHWRIDVWPAAHTVAESYSYGPSLAFAQGLLSALLIGVAIQLRQRAVQRTAEAERSAAALRDSEQRFDLAVRALQRRHMGEQGRGQWLLCLAPLSRHARLSPRRRESIGRRMVRTRESGRPPPRPPIH